MKTLFIIALSLTVFCVLLTGPAAAEEAKKEEAKAAAAEEAKVPAGQKAFTDAKCQMCHTVYSAGIGEAPAEGEEGEEDEDGPPDLSMSGVDRTAEWMTGFLTKKVELNGKKHMMSFKGDEKDLKSLVEWLLTLKPAEKDDETKAEAAEAMSKSKGGDGDEPAADDAVEAGAADDGDDDGADDADDAEDD